MTLDLTMYDVMKDLMEERLEINPRGPSYKEHLCPSYQVEHLQLTIGTYIKQMLTSIGQPAHDTLCRVTRHDLRYDVPSYLDFSLVCVDIDPDPNLDGRNLNRLLEGIESIFRRASLISAN